MRGYELFVAFLLLAAVFVQWTWPMGLISRWPVANEVLMIGSGVAVLAWIFFILTTPRRSHD